MKSAGGLEAVIAAGLVSATLDVAMPQGTTFELRNLSTGKEEKVLHPGKVRLPGGRYVATLRADGDRIIKRQEVELEGGHESAVDLIKWNNSAPHIAIARKLPTGPDGVQFSETLRGPEKDADLNVWLALLGAGRILGTSGRFSKIAPFPLWNFAGEPAGASPIYVSRRLRRYEDPAQRGILKDRPSAMVRGAATGRYGRHPARLSQGRARRAAGLV